MSLLDTLRGNNILRTYDRASLRTCLLALLGAVALLAPFGLQA
jgi:hypothetical protein